MYHIKYISVNTAAYRERDLLLLVLVLMGELLRQKIRPVPSIRRLGSNEPAGSRLHSLIPPDDHLAVRSPADIAQM